MVFNPDINKPAEEGMFTNRSSSSNSPVGFNAITMKSVEAHKHLQLILDSKLNFNKHFDENIFKANRIIGVIRRLHQYLPLFVRT